VDQVRLEREGSREEHGVPIRVQEEIIG
jgi:hypothetical protein